MIDLEFLVPFVSFTEQFAFKEGDKIIIQGETVVYHDGEWIAEENNDNNNLS